MDVYQSFDTTADGRAARSHLIGTCLLTSGISPDWPSSSGEESHLPARLIVSDTTAAAFLSFRPRHDMDSEDRPPIVHPPFTYTHTNTYNTYWQKTDRQLGRPERGYVDSHSVDRHRLRTVCTCIGWVGRPW